MKRLTLATLGVATVLLSGCSEDNGKRAGDKQLTVVNAEFNQDFVGMWKHSTKKSTYLSVADGSVVLYSKNKDSQCFDADVFRVMGIRGLKNSKGDLLDNRRVALRQLKSGDGLVRLFTLSENKQSMRVAARSIYNRISTATVPELAQCNDSEIKAQNLALSVEMNYLPDRVKVHREAASTGSVEYRWSAYFDVNHSNKLDADDVIVQINSSAKKADDKPAMTEVQQLDAKLLIKRAHKQEALTISDPDWKVSLDKTQNTLTVKLPMNYHPLLRRIDMKTPLKISTELVYPEPETDVVDGMLDGPWKWSSASHKDIYPNNGYVIPDNQNEMIDARDDQLGQSQWIDIRLTELTIK